MRWSCISASIIFRFSLPPSQITASGTATLSNGLSITTGGLSIGAGPLSVVAGGLASIGNLAVAAGSMSVTSSAPAGTGMDVYASGATMTGNVILGALTAGATTKNALTLYEGTNRIWQVCVMLVGFCSHV